MSGRMRRRLLAGALAAALSAIPAAPPAARAASGAERLDSAKTLFFDRKYAEARRAWQAVLEARGEGSEAAAYWIARCSENLGELDRAFREYGDYLDRLPADRALAEEARTSRVGIAARQVKAGRRERLTLLYDALGDTSKTVRYYAAFQLAGLGEDGKPAVPVLEGIVRKEKDEDLVERAKIALLRLDPGALSRTTRAPARDAPARKASWLKLRITHKGGSKPSVSINLPIGLAEVLYKSLPEDARRDLEKDGVDAGNFFERLGRLGPTEILSLEGEDGERIQIWIE
jgi:hypothetical protein